MDKKAIIGLIVFLGYPFLMMLLPLDLMTAEIGFWLLFILIILWVYYVEKRTIVSIGWKKLTPKLVFSAMGLGLLIFILLGVLTPAVQAMGIELNQETAELFAGQPLPVLFLIVLRAGIVEEVLYRGYAFERIFQLTKSKILAGLVPLILFMLVHLGWGPGHLIFVFFAGGLLTLAYALKRNLAFVIIAHFTADIIAICVLPLLLGT